MAFSKDFLQRKKITKIIGFENFVVILFKMFDAKGCSRGLIPNGHVLINLVPYLITKTTVSKFQSYLINLQIYL
jgi:hypothetical protein